MPHISFHPAPGLGELMPGWHIVPQNPIAPDYTELVPTPQARSGGRPVYVPHMGELMPAKFTEPENPIRNALGLRGCGGCGCGGGCKAGCGCPSAIGFSGLDGLGDSIMDTLTTGYTPWVIGGAALLLLFATGRGGREQRAYREDVEKARKRHLRRYQRVRRAIRAF